MAKYTKLEYKKALANIVKALENRTQIVEEIINFTSKDEQYILRDLFNQY